MGASTSIAVPYHKSKPNEVESHLLDALNLEAKYEAQVGYDREIIQTLLKKSGAGMYRLEPEKPGPTETEAAERPTGELGVSATKQSEIASAVVEDNDRFKHQRAKPKAETSAIDIEMLQSHVSPAAVARGSASTVLHKITSEISDKSKIIDAVFKPAAETKKPHDKSLRQFHFAPAQHTVFEPSVSESEEDIVQLEQAVISKGEFLVAVLNKITDAAAYNYKIYCQINQINGLIKKEPHPMKKMTLKRILAEKEKALETCLGHFDNAKSASLWLQKDYGLAFEIIMLHNEADELEAKTNHKKQELDSFPSDQKPRVEAQIAAKRQELEACLARLANVRQRQMDILTEVGDLQLSALTVGFRYLDRNHSGCIEPEDLPELAPAQFTRLDIDKSHAFDITEFERALKKMQDEVKDMHDQITSVQNRKQQINNEMVRFQSTLTNHPSVTQTKQLEHLEAQMLEAELESKDLQEKLLKHQELVREIARIFQQGFIMNVFWLLPVPTRAQPILPKERPDAEVAVEKHFCEPATRYALIISRDGVRAAPLPSENPVAAPQAPEIIVDPNFLKETERFRKLSDKNKQQEAIQSIQKDLAGSAAPTTGQVYKSKETEAVTRDTTTSVQEPLEEEQREGFKSYVPAATERERESTYTKQSQRDLSP